MTVSLRSIAGRPSLPVRKVVEQLGGRSAWTLGMDTLEVWSELQKVSFHRGQLQVSSPLSVKPSAFVLTNPDRLVVDLDGTRLGRNTVLDLEDNAKATQIRPNTVRITIETDRFAQAPAFDRNPTRNFFLAFDGSKKPPIVVTNDTIKDLTVDPGHEDDLPPLDTTPIQPVPQANGELPLIVNLEGSSATLLSVRLPGFKAPTFTKPDPATLEVKLPGVSLRLPDGFRLDTTAVRSASTRLEGSTTVLTLNLSRPLGAEVWGDADGVQIQLLKPNVGNGKLAGKIVVVDAGHGGHDRGAHVGSVNEKDLTLSISRLLSMELASQGATVIMTRKSDVFISLNERAAIANRNKADLFVSVHINSNGKSNSTSGTITFYHKGRGVGKLLAECLHEEISKVNGLPDIGVWSDGRIYNSGFAVLRQTSMPGVLLELGFINHSRDRARMVTSDFQQSIAEAVVKGLKVYLGDE
jgi:N-acetylmuramoyl-L-alanine amidase